MSVSTAARKMMAAGVDAGLVVTGSGELKGILTDTDVARKVLAPGLDPAQVKITAVMTPNPQSASKRISGCCRARPSRTIA